MRRDVSILIPYKITNGEILVFLERRSKTANRLPDYFGFWGGGIEAGETPEQALSREIIEEMSFKLSNFEFYKKYQFGESVKYIYSLLVDESFESKIKFIDAQYGKFFTEDEIIKEKRLIEDDKKVLEDFLSLLKKRTPPLPLLCGGGDEIYMRKILTLCIIHQHPRVLLGMKKRGFGAGRWNGFGGKVEAGETIEEAAKRELLEESGLTAADINQLGTVEFSWPNIKDDVLEVHIFKAEKFTGEPIESEEMRPQWFEVADIPFDQMWTDDKYWFDYFLNNKKFKAKFYFDEADKVVDYLLEDE